MSFCPTLMEEWFEKWMHRLTELAPFRTLMRHEILRFSLPLSHDEYISGLVAALELQRGIAIPILPKENGSGR